MVLLYKLAGATGRGWGARLLPLLSFSAKTVPPSPRYCNQTRDKVESWISVRTRERTLFRVYVCHWRAAQRAVPHQRDKRSSWLVGRPRAGREYLYKHEDTWKKSFFVSSLAAVHVRFFRREVFGTSLYTLSGLLLPLVHFRGHRFNGCMQTFRSPIWSDDVATIGAPRWEERR